MISTVEFQNRATLIIPHRKKGQLYRRLNASRLVNRGTKVLKGAAGLPLPNGQLPFLPMGANPGFLNNQGITEVSRRESSKGVLVGYDVASSF